MTNYDRALMLMIHNSEVADKAVHTFLISESVILGFLGKGFSELEPGDLFNMWLFGGSVLGFLLVGPWWASYSFCLRIESLLSGQVTRYEDSEYKGEDRDEVAIQGQLLTEGNALREEIRRDLKPFGKMQIRTAYRILMIVFALAFLLMAIVPFLINK